MVPEEDPGVTRQLSNVIPYFMKKVMIRI